MMQHLRICAVIAVIAGIIVYVQTEANAQTCPTCSCGDPQCDSDGNCTCQDQPACDCGDAFCGASGWTCQSAPSCDEYYEPACYEGNWECTYVGSGGGGGGDGDCDICDPTCPDYDEAAPECQSY